MYCIICINITYKLSVESWHYSTVTNYQNGIKNYQNASKKWDKIFWQLLYTVSVGIVSHIISCIHPLATQFIIFKLKRKILTDTTWSSIWCIRLLCQKNTKVLLWLQLSLSHMPSSLVNGARDVSINSFQLNSIS